MGKIGKGPAKVNVDPCIGQLNNSLSYKQIMVKRKGYGMIDPPGSRAYGFVDLRIDHTIPSAQSTYTVDRRPGHKGQVFFYCEQLSITIKFEWMIIHIAKELRGTRAYDAVYTHEQKHESDCIEIFSDFALEFEKELNKKIPSKSAPLAITDSQSSFDLTVKKYDRIIKSFIPIAYSYENLQLVTNRINKKARDWDIIDYPRVDKAMRLSGF